MKRTWDRRLLFWGAGLMVAGCVAIFAPIALLLHGVTEVLGGAPAGAAVAVPSASELALEVAAGALIGLALVSAGTVLLVRAFRPVRG